MTRFKLENKENLLKISLDGKVLYEIKKGGKKPFIINRQRGEEKGVKAKMEMFVEMEQKRLHTQNKNSTDE